MTVKDMRELAARDGFACFYCGMTQRLTKFTIDHWIPTCRGGPNTIENMRLADFQCNHMKGPLTGDEFMILRRNDAERKRYTKVVMATLGLDKRDLAVEVIKQMMTRHKIEVGDLLCTEAASSV